ncbi:hypothetical protein [Roseibium album]|uniref:hypothetical protein n=1 Tax=Roseibium album TaxID=311410 RepID=UPI0024927C5E|nr:hypothetical protein [Roseibium album]
MKPIILRVNLSEDDKYDIDIYQSPHSVEEFRSGIKSNFDPREIEGEKLNSAHYGMVTDLYEDSAAFHATKAGLEYMDVRVGYVKAKRPDTHGYSTLAIFPPGPITKPSSISEADFIGRLQELDHLLGNLIDAIGGINDPELNDLSLAKVKASAQALRCYIDIENVNGPLEVPREAATNLQDRMESVDWSKLSEQLRTWAPLIISILKMLLGL